MLAFTSVPLTLTKFANIVESTMNSRTARRFFQPTAGFSTKGRTRRPGKGSNEVVDNAEPESEADQNPAYEFTFAQDFEDWLPTTGAETCGGCFVCKARTPSPRSADRRRSSPPARAPLGSSPSSASSSCSSAAWSASSRRETTSRSAKQHVKPQT
jgi:hypothetical protein